ncbi:hypothetical protein [Micromonospora cathayae]|uniref:Phosphotransferase enzyme family protein n=1 Tax=Micromonospora cathayae TaxID=3028804 RepID=A0ABY7ZVI6_9ACTN|nr:hypothetical protein [Micromonospora sp. HUAS 3]WDZ87032.1 hypothetical protein PVK37_11825 [Micromonospora sp. HUAS 3]
MSGNIGKQFADYVGDTAISDALVRWATALDGTISSPSRPHRARGTTAELFEVAYTEAVTPYRPRPLTRKLFVKVLPVDLDSREPDRHRAALRNAGEFRRHLAGQPFRALHLRDGRQLMFQELVNGGGKVRTLDELRGDDLVHAYRAVVRAVVQRWNAAGSPRRKSGQPVEETNLGAYVTGEMKAVDALTEVLTVAGRFRPTANDPRRLAADGRPLPDPLRLFDPTSRHHAQPVSYCAGHSHGDLHGRNVLVPCSPTGGSLPDDFTLVDLSAYRSRAPLARDPVFLMLSTVLRFLPQLTGSDADALAGYLVRPERGRPPTLRGPAAGFAQIIHEEGLAYSRPDRTPGWWMQARLSLLSQSLVCTTYDNLGPDRRRWCFRLAALALAAIEEDDRPVGPNRRPTSLPG